MSDWANPRYAQPLDACTLIKYALKHPTFALKYVF